MLTRWFGVAGCLLGLGRSGGQLRGRGGLLGLGQLVNLRSLGSGPKDVSVVRLLAVLGHIFLSLVLHKLRGVERYGFELCLKSVFHP